MIRPGLEYWNWKGDRMTKLKIREAATILGVSTDTVRRRIRTGELEAELHLHNGCPTWFIERSNLGVPFGGVPIAERLLSEWVLRAPWIEVLHEGKDQESREVWTIRAKKMI